MKFFCKPFTQWRRFMATVIEKENAILTNLAALSQAVTDLATAVANIHSGGTTDISGLQASIDKLQGSVDTLNTTVGADVAAPAA